MKQLLIIGHTFPEPSTTAAGSRMMQLVELFQEENYQITFASTAAFSEKTENLHAQNISVKNIRLNDASFDEFIKELNPEIVIFDRYITEEQFGWRVSENCPNALKILDTEDLHFLRKAREEAVKNNKPISEANLFSETAKRELASILRCDLSLIISEYEIELLQNTFKISSEILYYLPFLVETISENTPSFEQRQNFFTIGNLLHAPNVDSVLQLKQIWPEIKSQLPEAELHIYGAYAPQQILQLNNKKEGFIIKGWAEDVETVMKNYRVQLAPLRFGAGLKGKLLDGMQFGLPSVTTEVGAEGMNGELQIGGSVTTSKEDFINASVKLYSEEKLWNQAQLNGFEIIKQRFQKSLFSEDFKRHIRTLSLKLEKHRQENFIGQIFQHHTLQSTKYLSKWIAEKNSSK
ncbi:MULTISPECIES: glycosyltransferase [Aequorivita]|uniref:Glycosyltransferase family 4 protein n=1 Tax=Aequorivita iocasae TaxID=2803865 RepID=A0ABX7DS38_9FLAO|nr:MULTISPECIES: glycosyltransferase [Aequorivita]QQX75604.1 glycosyltransferase family 4 protein [Aequorivita iocasae]UCA55058.1 glycosyltransferase family 4 protein [Aequorivita sp. F7]